MTPAPGPDGETWIYSCEITCPCGGTVTAGETSKSRVAGLHTSPPCERFLEMDLYDFVHWLYTVKNQ